VAWAGGFFLVWLYGEPWFLNFELFGQNMRDLFQMGTVNLSVAVWVGFIALFGVASDGGVVMATYLDQLFDKKKPESIEAIKAVVVEASSRRIRPTLMTTATTILALLPVLTSTGRGADIMVPMAIPSVGGMLLQIITLFVVPVLYAFWKEFNLKRSLKK
jgi:Cu(I)/Ag(I) efflux system membrane protein CusA/SilA